MMRAQWNEDAGEVQLIDEEMRERKMICPSCHLYAFSRDEEAAFIDHRARCYNNAPIELHLNLRLDENSFDGIDTGFGWTLANDRW